MKTQIKPSEQLRINVAEESNELSPLDYSTVKEEEQLGKNEGD